jgi:hypothetical protein
MTKQKTKKISNKKHKKLTFNENFPKHIKKKKSDEDSDDEDFEIKMENREHKTNYQKQMKENIEHTRRQIQAVNEHLSPTHWDDLDSMTGPKIDYRGKLEIEEGPLLLASLNKLTNRVLKSPKSPKQNKKSTKRHLGVWGGKKSRKSKK